MKTITPLSGIALIACLTISPSLLFAQWVQTAGPTGGAVRAMTANGVDLFAGTAGGGCFRSTDRGQTWESRSVGLPHTEITSLTFNGAMLLAGTQWKGIYRSINEGAKWNEVNGGLSPDQMEQGTVYSIVVKGMKLFAALGNALYSSSDHGEHWQMTGSGLPSLKKTHCFEGGLVVIGSVLVAGNTARGVFRTTDDGASWSAANAGLPDTMLCDHSLVKIDSALFVLTLGGGVYRSADSGAHWSAANSGLPSVSVTAFEAVGTSLMAICRDSLYCADDANDVHWRYIAAVPSAVRLWYREGSLFIGKSSALYRSDDSGVHWVSASDSMKAQSIYALAGNGVQLLAGTTTKAIYRTPDKGSTWIPLSAERVNGMVNCLAFSGPILIAGGSSQDGGIDISTDMGASWRRVTPGHDAQIEAMAVQSPYVYAAGEGIWVSADDGSSWTRRNVGGRYTYLGELAILDSIVYTGFYYGDSIYVSSDKGATWRPLYGKKGLSIFSLAATGQMLLAGTYGNGVYRSLDRGATWTAVNAGLGDTIVYDIAASNGAIFAATQDHGVYASQDEGVTWTAVNTGLSTPHIFRLAVHAGELYAGTWGEGVWKRPLSEITSVATRSDPAVPMQFTLGQNFPNPFNPSTTIRYEVPAPAVVRLSLFDVLGREVAVLVNEPKARGAYEVRFDGASYPSGIYYYRMSSGAFTQTRRCVLLR